MLFGYARVSTAEQSLDLQFDALEKAGVEKNNIFFDVASGVKAERRNLELMKNYLRKGDTVIVWKLDRIARNVKHLTSLIDFFHSKGVHFKSIQEPFIDTSSSYGQFIFNIFSSLAQFERDLISERTKAGLESARRRGKFLGRPVGLSKEAKNKAKICEVLYKENKLTVSQILKIVNVSRRTFYKYLRYQGVEVGKDYSSDS